MNRNRIVELLVCSVLLVSVKEIMTQTVLTRLENLALLTENSNMTLDGLWHMNGSYNDPNKNKNVAQYYDIIPDGNFRSSVVDTWYQNPPTEIAVMLFNNIGDLLFWLLYDVRNSDMKMKTWMTNSRLLGASLNGFSFQSVESVWNVSGYQYVLSSLTSPNSSWFAVANFSDGNSGYPTFLIPLNDSSPFVIPAAQNMTTDIDLLHYEKLKNVKEFIVDVTNDNNPIYMTRVLCTNLISKNLREDYTLQYSMDNCSVGESNKLSYRDKHGYVVTGEEITIEPIYVSCIWITFERSMWSLEFSIFGPSANSNGFIAVPVILFRGYWYKEQEVSVTTDSVQIAEENTTSTTKLTSPDAQTHSILYINHTTEALTTKTRKEQTTRTNAVTKISNNTLSSLVHEESSYLQSTELTVKTISGSSLNHLTSVTETPEHSTIITVGTENSESNSESSVTSSVLLNSSVISGLTGTCFCTCLHSNSSVAITEETLEEKLKQIKKELTVNKKQLSSYVRTLISVSDDRLSARSMGYLAGGFLGLILGVIIILDLSSLQQNVHNVLRRSIYKRKFELE